MEHAHANLVQFFIHNFKISLRLQKDAELFNEIPVVDVVDNHPFVELSNGLTTKIHELKNLTDNTKIDIITIQETKLKPTHRTPYLKDYTAIRTDRTYKNGGGLMTYIKTT